MFSFSFVSNLFAQTAKITFTADKDCEVIIYEPIDGTHNTKIPSSRLVATKNQPVTYTTDISSYTFVYCQFPQYPKSCDVILFPNDSIVMSVTESGITFQGNNSAGQQYFYDSAQKEPFLKKTLGMQHIAKEYIEKKRGIHSVMPAIIDTLQLAAHIKNIEELPLTSNTTAEYAKVLKSEQEMFYATFIMADVIDHIRHNTRKYEHIAKDSAEINKLADSLFQKYPLKYEYLKYSSLIYIIKYLSFYHRQKGCPQGYDPETFGPYKTYLYAPEEMQPGLLGGACMVQLKYDTGEMNLAKLKKFFNERFPKSEYTAIINQKVKDDTGSELESPADSYLINDPIDFLSQLNNLPELQGKYLFVDLWASWCMPCRGEFSYREQLHQIFSKHKQIVPVYISIDRQKQEEAWKNCIKHYNLEGYHLRASEKLVGDIERRIYGAARFDVPRYALISPDGEILNADLPRPSQYPKLEKVIDSLIIE